MTLGEHLEQQVMELRDLIQEGILLNPSLPDSLRSTDNPQPRRCRLGRNRCQLCSEARKFDQLWVVLKTQMPVGGKGADVIPAGWN
jgi:hypothetical protein